MGSRSDVVTVSACSSLNLIALKGISEMRKLGLACALLVGPPFFVSCSPDKPAQSAPPPVVEQKRVEPRPVLPPSTPDADATKEDEEETDPAFADAPAKPLGKEETRILIKALPLRLDAIRFEAIDKFLLLYAPFTSNKSLLRETRKQIRAAQNCVSIPVASFPLGMRPPEFVGMLKSPPNRFYIPAIGALSNVVSRTRQVIMDLHEQVRDQLSGSEEGEIVGQIGNRPTDNSVTVRNLDSLEGLLRAGNFELKPASH